MADMEMNVPDGWDKMNIGQILETTRNGFSGQQVDYITPFPVTRIETISDWKINYEKVGYVKQIPLRYELMKGDMLFSNINSIKHIGKLAYVEEGSVLYHGMNLLLFRFTESVDTRFIYYYLLTRKKWFEQVATQAINQASINQSTLRGLEVIIPVSLTEQRQIARILSKVDEAITQTEQLIAKYRRLKTGLIQDLLTKGINGSNNNLVLSQLKGIEINSDFIQTTFRNISKVRQGYQIAISHRKQEEGPDRLIYVTVQYLNNPKKYSEYIENPPEGVVCEKDDILFTRTGNTGQIVTNINGVFHNNFFKVSFDKEKVNKDYLVAYLNWKPVQDLIKELAGTTTIPDMKHGDFYEMPVFYPKDLNEQIKVSNAIKSASDYLNTLKSDLSKLQSLKTGLMQDLLSGKVRVEQLIRETAAA